MPNLDTLLQLLRAKGISVGAAEYRRLQQILQSQHQLSSRDFRDLLSTVLAKNDEQRKQITDTFEYFTRESVDYDPVSGAASASDKKQRPADTNNEAAEVSKPPKQKDYMPWIAGALGVITLALLVAYFHDIQEAEAPKQAVPVKEKTNVIPQAVPAAKLKAVNEEKPLITDLPVWSIEDVTLTARPVMQEFIPPFLLFLGSTGGFLWLLSKALRRTRQRKPEAITYRRALGYHTPDIKHAHYKLFNAQDRQTLSWGVGHYFDDQQQQRIDVEQSVAASANEGFPVIAFEQSRHEREVWLWQDRLNPSPLQLRMIQEIKQALTQANIHVKHGFFNGVPYQITDSQQRPEYQVVGALPEPVPLVLLCLDANNVNTAFSQSKHSTEQVFQHLRQWSTLAVVDCNPAVASLKSTLNDYQLPYLLPSQVADWFSRQGSGEMRRKVCVLSDVYRWACACALAQRIITEDEAYALHAALNLNCAWQYSHLRKYGRACESGLDFSNTQVERINDLDEDDRQLAIRFWLTRFKAIDQMYLDGTEYPNWQDSYVRYQAVKIPIALLGLWNESPTQAINTLDDYFQHHRGDLQRPIKKHLAHYSCEGMTGVCKNDDGTSDYIQLPFNWESLAASEKQQLLAMGFAGHSKQLSLQMDKVSGLLMGGLAGLVCYALYQSTVVLMDKPVQLQTRLNSAAPLQTVEYNEEGRIFLGTAKHHLDDVSALIKAKYPDNDSLDNKLIEVNWLRAVTPAQETIRSGGTTGETAQLWRLGTRRYPPKRQPNALGQDIVASHAFIQAMPDNATAQTLAIQLLDSGSADQVWIASKLTPFQKRFSNWVRLSDDADAKQQMQRITIGKSITDRQADLSGMPNTLVYEGELATLLANLSNKKYDQQTKDQMEKLGFEVKGSPVLQNPLPMDEPIMLGNGIKLMPIPAGSFEMGSNNGEDDEKPVHTVTISQPFWVGESEVTFDQYQAYTTATGKIVPEDQGWGKASRPVINVSWQEAVEYTQWLTKNNSKGMSCRLPSEAEWEYAARAGSTTKFYWGDEESREYVNYSGVGGRDQWDRETAPVKQFQPNKFGLYDMSGNVYEWVQDNWHDDYTGAPEGDSVWEARSSTYYVLRGGSWADPSYFVRSADRGSFDFGFSGVGFRVVCSPPLRAEKLNVGTL